MSLKQLELEIEDVKLPDAVEAWLAAGRARIERYWDQFPQKPLPQYIECDFDYVSRALAACVAQELNDGNLFCEWGCGFGIVTGVAALLGLDAIGIEAEVFLCAQARELLEQNQVRAEIWQGNFLPLGSAQLAEEDDPLVSLTHKIPPAYQAHDMLLSDFALTFVYPWPGEEHFLRAVFDRFARPGALMLQFRGPYHVELYRKGSR
ncbi:MAG: class I SAM-dependent methyltransferase [Aureliella sp.]